MGKEVERERKMIPTITFTAPVGGVGRTTHTFNIGWGLAALGKKVLLVDADPSCILSQLFMNDCDKCDRITSRVSVDDGKFLNLFESMHTVTYPSDVCLPHCDVASHQNNHNLMLLPGSRFIVDLDSKIKFFLTSQDSFYLDILRGFHTVVQRTAKKHDADVVLIDINSNCGPFNMLVVMFSTYLIVPVRDDFFSYNAIRNFYRIISSWKNDRDTVINSDASFQYLSKYSLPLPTETPKFIGLLQILSHNDAGEINSFLTHKLIPRLREYNMLFPESQIFPCSDFAEYDISAQIRGLPLIALRENEDINNIVSTTDTIIHHIFNLLC